MKVEQEHSQSAVGVKIYAQQEIVKEEQVALVACWLRILVQRCVLAARPMVLSLAVLIETRGELQFASLK